MKNEKIELIDVIRKDTQEENSTPGELSPLSSSPDAYSGMFFSPRLQFQMDDLDAELDAYPKEPDNVIKIKND
jgi:hypothetical protein